MTRKALLIFFVTLGLWGCDREPDPPKHLVLVTIDTLRADRVGVYGATDVETPSMDRIAKDGAMAVRATAHMPLTRPSHASLFTALLPTRHRIRDNIAPARLPDVATLTSVMKAAGFRTGGFVSSVVLSGGGFERDFDLFSADFGGDEEKEEKEDESALFLNSLQRPGHETLEQASNWIETHHESPIFAWVHLYEPHDPYEPPEPYRTRYADRLYDGEVAYADELVGRLDATLERLGLRQDTLLVVTSDHGEGLGEHGENLHGFFVYEPTLSVPLVLRGPGVEPGTRLKSLVRIVDLFPTLVELMGLEIPNEAELSGVSVAGALGGGPEEREPVAYAESLVPLLHFGWSDLRSIRRGKWKYIQAPRPELYDLESDPKEAENVAGLHPDLVRGMRRALGEELDAERKVGAEPNDGGESVSQDLLDQLGALGYVGSGAPVDTSTPGADPKDKIAEFRRASALIREGLVLFHEGKFEDSVERYRELLAIPIESFEVHLNLARGLLALEQYREAEPHFEEAASRIPVHVGAWEGLSQCRSARGDLPAALDALREGQKASEDDAELRRREGAILVQMGRAVEARAAYEAAVARAPKDPLLRARFGELLRGLGDIDLSIEQLREAVALDPADGSYVNSLGMTLGGNGRLGEAEAAFRRAVELAPENALYAFNLGLILLRQNRPVEARASFEKALAIEPDFEEARRLIGEIGAR